MKIISEDDLLIGDPIIVGVLKDEELILRASIADAVVWVAFHGRDPKTSFIVKSNLHGVLEIGKSFF